MNRTAIEYLHRTWNPVAMCCTRVSAGCDHCWHLRMAHRLARIETLRRETRKAWVGGKPWLDEAELRAPLTLGRPSRIGVQFMGDLFHERISRDFVELVYEAMAEAKRHTFIVCTKRPERIVPTLYHPECAYFGGGDYLPNVWHLTSVEDQATYEQRWPELCRLRTEGSPGWPVLGLSVEPMLGPVQLRDAFPTPDWLICGAETGPGARPVDFEWVRDLREQCANLDIPFFLKSLGKAHHGMVEALDRYPLREFPIVAKAGRE